MEDLAFWNTRDKEHTRLYVKFRIMDEGYCLECRKPNHKERHYLCPTCLSHLKLSGLEQKRVKFKDVGANTINYQQYLHRTFFGCNVGVDYRGKREDRIKSKVPQEDINKACKVLEKYFLYKTDLVQQKELYMEVKDLRNTLRRLLYSITLYAISYFILNYKEFKSLAHFQASIVRQLDNDLVRMYIRTHRGQPVEKNNTGKRTVVQLLKQYKAIVSAITYVIPHLHSDTERLLA